MQQPGPASLLSDAAAAALICDCFNDLFGPAVQMQGGGDEPLYVPPAAGRPGRIIFNRDFPASALHEAAHWCLAGAARRAQVDYGYLDLPPPRSPAQQAAFCRWECRVQAVELLLTQATGLPFRVSLDDLAVSPQTRVQFAAQVQAAAQQMQVAGLPPRGAALRAALARAFAAGRTAAGEKPHAD